MCHPSLHNTSAELWEKKKLTPSYLRQYFQVDSFKFDNQTQSQFLLRISNAQFTAHAMIVHSIAKHAYNFHVSSLIPFIKIAWIMVKP